MSVLSKYILRQTIAPLAMFAVVLSLIVWLTQSLQMLDVVMNRGQTPVTFLMLTLYVMPSLLAVIVPFATFCASLYALHRLSNDSELVVLWSAGVGTWTVAKPILLIGVVTAIATLLLNLYLMPAGYRQMKDEVYAIRGDIAANLVRDGTFSNPQEGLTVYNRETRANGTLNGLLVHDSRNPKRPVTYLAERGRFVQTPDGPRLVMDNGNSQQVNENGDVSVLYFERYTLDLTQFAGNPQTNQRELSERYLHELLAPDLSQSWERKNQGRLRAEGHNRLASSLYSIAFVMIALYAVCVGNFSRRGNAWRIAAAMAAGLTVRLVGFGVQNLAETRPIFIVAQYLVPVIVVAACAYVLFARGAVTRAIERFGLADRLPALRGAS